MNRTRFGGRRDPFKGHFVSSAILPLVKTCIISSVQADCWSKMSVLQSILVLAPSLKI